MDGYSVSITLDEAREIIKKQKNKEKGAPVYFQELVLYMGALRVVRAHERGDKLPEQGFYYPIEPSLSFLGKFQKKIKKIGDKLENKIHITMFSGISKVVNKKWKDNFLFKKFLNYLRRLKIWKKKKINQ